MGKVVQLIKTHKRRLQYMALHPARPEGLECYEPILVESVDEFLIETFGDSSEFAADDELEALREGWVQHSATLWVRTSSSGLIEYIIRCS